MVLDMSEPEIFIAFSLHGNFDPQEATRLIGREPSRTWRMGEVRVPHSPLVYQSSGWRLEVGPVRGWSAEGPLSELLIDVWALADRIALVVKTFGLRSELSCSIYASGRFPAVSLDSTAVRQLADLGASLDIDITLSD